jgi:flagellar hook-associated protein 2
MANIISAGIGSGLDIAGLVQSLVAAEAEPVESRLGRQEARVQSKLSAFGSLKSALAEFRDALDTMRELDSFLTRKAASGNEDLFQAVVEGNALPASYDLEVAQVAQSQKLNSGAFADADTAIGTGTLLLSVGADSFGVAISSENNTLAGIRDAINDAVDNPGVAATIVNADSGSYLILSGEKTGVANAITVNQTGGDGGLAALEYDPGAGLNSLTETIAAQDALIRIDGLDVISDTNSISGAVQGVTIDVFGSDPGQRYSLLVANDEAAARETVNSFVDSYNELIATFDRSTSFDAEQSVAGPLLGDSTVRGIRDEIRRELSVATLDIDATFSTLTEVGIELQVDGTMQINEEALTGTLEQDFSKFGQLFATSDGFAVRLFDRVEGYLAADGLLEARTEGLTDQIDSIGEQREASNERLLSLEARLLRQFNALDTLLGELGNTSNFLAQQLGNLPGFTSNNNG